MILGSETIKWYTFLDMKKPLPVKVVEALGIDVQTRTSAPAKERTCKEGG